MNGQRTQQANLQEETLRAVRSTRPAPSVMPAGSAGGGPPHQSQVLKMLGRLYTREQDYAKFLKKVMDLREATVQFWPEAMALKIQNKVLYKAAS